MKENMCVVLVFLRLGRGTQCTFLGSTRKSYHFALTAE